MNSDDKAHAQALVRRLLGEARDHATAGAFQEALSAVRKARGLDPSNVFILAFERQIEQIQEHLTSGTLSEDQRRDIIDSLSGIVQNATAPAPPAAGEADAAAQPEPAPEQREQVRAARQWLKNQYLQRAHSYVLKKDYEKALSEIRRVFIIDDRDRFAREFELKVMQMLEVSRRKTLVFNEDGLEKHAGGATAPATAPAAAAPVTAEETPSPAPSSPPPATRGGKVVRITLIATIVVLAFAFYYFWKREQPRPVTITPTEEQTAPVNEGDEPVYKIPPAGHPDSAKTDTAGHAVPR
jgi:hypothetical protein